MVVAGTATSDTRWSTTSDNNRFFVDPGYNTFWLYYPDNTWRVIANRRLYGEPGNSVYTVGYLSPLQYYGNTGYPLLSGYYPDEVKSLSNKCFDGSYLLRDVTVISAAEGGPYNATMGVLDGVYWIPGRENSAENVVTKDTVDHIVFQNLYRNDFGDYMAMRLQ